MNQFFHAPQAAALPLSLFHRPDAVPGQPQLPVAAAGRAEPMQHHPTFAVAALGLLCIGLLALVAAQQHRWRRRLHALDHDPSTGLLSRFALERALAEPATPPAGDSSQALLITLDVPLLDRQRLFLSEAERVAILATAAGSLRRRCPGDSGGDPPLYRAGEHRIAAILPPSSVLDAGDPAATRSWLGELLVALRAAIEQLGTLPLAWDDLQLTAQWFLPQGPHSSLLAPHAFCPSAVPGGEGRILRLLDRADEQRAREDAELRRQLIGLTEADIDLHFQPILLLADPGCFALELLLRFRAPRLRRLGTAAVLQHAREIGIAHRIDDLVVDQLPLLQERLRADPLLRQRIAYISFNLSADSLASEERLALLMERLQRRQVDASLFRVEITEMAAGHSHPGAVDMATASERLMRELDLRVLIDDFGSGLSNYRRISEAWYDAIKLDIELIRGIGQSFRLQRYVGSFIAAVHGLGKTVVAEGIEHYADLVVAVRQGADALQGFHIAAPLPWQELKGFLTESEWASGRKVQRLIEGIAASDRMLEASGLRSAAAEPGRVPLERYILDNWSALRSFEEFVLLFVGELRSWGLELHRFSLAFLPDQDDIDCNQYIWLSRAPAEVQALRMPREFLEREEHLSSPLRWLAVQGRLIRYRFNEEGDRGFPFLTTLRTEGCSDYLGLRLESRGVSIPVLTIALRGGAGFQDTQIQRIEAMSSLLSLLFHAFESERARRLALLDALTALPNRRSFDSFLRSRVVAATRCREPLALALIDLDRFKLINDTLGHAVGDLCLREVATLLAAHLPRSTGFIARLGGEEFGLILPNHDARDAFAVGEELRERVEAARILHPDAGSDHRLTISIGIAVWRPESGIACDPDPLLQLADDGLYAAKRGGRNRVVCRTLDAGAGSSAVDHADPGPG